MDKFYTVAENTLILISLMKQYNIRKVVASPGTLNVNFVGSLQSDPFFEIYSAPDERSAAYIACGMAAESGEPVVLSCTGATASRNYIPGLTEAFYRKLPVIAVTSTQRLIYIGHNCEQVIDRRSQLNDMVRYSATLPIIHNDEDKWNVTIEVNKAFIETTRHGGGPVHINLEAETQRDFSVKELPKARKINYFCATNDSADFPELKGKRVAVYVGSHRMMDEGLQNAITKFCETNDAVVLCDRTSNYFGKYRVVPSLVVKQDAYSTSLSAPDVMIHIGNVSGSQFKFSPKEVWRVCEDGEIRDTYKAVKNVFEMNEQKFFEMYSKDDAEASDTYLNEWKKETESIYQSIPELPFSNMWVAYTLSERIPDNSVLHLGILNSLRSWDYFDSPNVVEAYANTGGFGIDGCLSSLIGGALANPSKLHFGALGDLAFFYDMNSLGNRHLPNNLRILVVNNGKGAEFRKYNHPAGRFGEDADLYMAAAGHYGNKSNVLLKHYVEDLGFLYLTADNKEDFLANAEKFLDTTVNQPVVFEVFTTEKNDSDAIQIINNLEKSIGGSVKAKAKSLLGDKGFTIARKVLKK